MGHDYSRQIHRMGKLSCLLAILLILLVPGVITLAFQGQVDISIPQTLNAILVLTAIYGPVCIIEVVSYSPILGVGGTYLSFITGNIMNMKLPAAANAMAVNEVERGSEEGEIISTLAIGASSIVTTAILFLGMLFLGRLLVPVITSTAMAPAFNNVTPALLGALAAQSFLKDLKLAVLPVAAGVAVYLVMGNAYMSTNSSYWMLPFILVMFAAYVGMYKLGIIKEHPPAGGQTKNR